MNLSKKQKEIVETENEKVIAICAAASGKTTILVARTRHLLENGVDPKDIVLLTFTNSAAEELYTRLNRPKNLFVGTIHSYANSLLIEKGYQTHEIIEEERFNELFESVKCHPDCLKPVKYLLLDESQDSNFTQFEFILDVVNPQNYMLVGDYRQCIYRWNKADPDYLINLSKNFDVVTYDLNENYRNGNTILGFAKRIIARAGYEYKDNSIPMSLDDGQVIDIPFNATKLVRYLQNTVNYKDWFVLTRTNAQLDDIMGLLQEANIPCDTFKRADMDNTQLRQRMEANTVKVLTIHTSKGLEADNVIVIGANMFNTEETCVSYVAATRARHLLIWMDTKLVKRKTYAYNKPRTKELNWE